MKKIKVILLSLFAVITLITLIIMIVYLSTFNKGTSTEVADWDLFLTLYNGIIVSALTMANIGVFYVLTITIENKNEDRFIRGKLHNIQKVLTDLRTQEYVQLKSEITNLFTNSFSKKDTSQNRNAILSILMRMENSILFCCSDNIAVSVLKLSIGQITTNMTEELTKDNYDKIVGAMHEIEICLFVPLFNENKIIEYIRKNKNDIDPTILGVSNYLNKKFGYSK